MNDTGYTADIHSMRKYVTFICLFVTIYTVHFLNLPPWWDGTTTVITSIETLKANMDPYVDFFAKPPLIFLSLGSLFKLFGYSPAVIHIFMLLFSLTAIIFTYKICELLSGEEVALAATGLLAFSPLFIAQSVNLNFDLPSMTLIIVSYYYLLKKNHLKYAIVSTLLVMTKEVGILFAVAVLLSTAISFVFERKKADNTGYKKAYAAQIVPISVFILWAYGNFVRYGWFVFPRESPILGFESILNDNFFMRLKQLFIINFNWILMAIITVYVIMWIYKKIHERIYKQGQYNGFDSVHKQHSKQDYTKYESLLPMVLFTFLFLIIAAPIRDFNLPRYVIVLYPQLYFVSSLAIFSMLGKHKRIFWIVILVIIALFTAQTAYSQVPFVFIDPLTQEVYSGNPGTTLGGSEIAEINLKYVDYVEADVELVRFLDRINSSAPVILNRFNHYNMFMAADKKIDLGYGMKSGRPNIDLNTFYKEPDKIKLPAILILEDFNRYDAQNLSVVYNLQFINNISIRGAGVELYWINNSRP